MHNQVSNLSSHYLKNIFIWHLQIFYYIKFKNLNKQYNVWYGVQELVNAN